MEESENTNTKWDSFFLDLQERERYTFTFDELRNRFGVIGLQS
jgi:hypothetical protein